MIYKTGYTKDLCGSDVVIREITFIDTPAGMKVISDSEVCRVTEERMVTKIMDALVYSIEHKCPPVQVHGSNPGWGCPTCGTGHNRQPERCTYCGTLTKEITK